ncbi:MAG: ABC transporter permease [Verrucomicrobiota bacterium]|nr:ABC transporter permease [Verrucomicrobiota bacterium]
MEALRNTWLISRRELKSYFGSPVAYVFLVVFLLMIGGFTFLVHRYYEAGQADLRWFFFWHPWVYLLLVPAVAMRLWSEERRSGTIEMLLTLPVTMPQAIMGKFLAAWGFLGLGLALTCPIVFTTSRILQGDLDKGAVVAGYLGSFFVAGVYLSVGLWSSSLTKNQVVSFVIAVVINLLLVIIGFGTFSDLLIRWGAPARLVEGVALAGIWPHFDSIQRGVLDIRDLGYYASVILVMLMATRLTLQNRKTT